MKMNTLMPNQTSDLEDALATTLLANLAAFQSFARNRLHDDQLAADAVQESLLRALQSESQLSDDRNLLAWFYRILRNVLTDMHRRRGTQRVAFEKFAEEMEGEASVRELEAAACACLTGLLPTLRPEYAEVVRLLDLGGRAPAEVARELGITPGNLKVRLHRGRRQLRQRLEETCRVCATHFCLDCTCEPQS